MSFFERHPILSIIIILGYVVFAAIPPIVMFFGK